MTANVRLGQHAAWRAEMLQGRGKVKARASVAQNLGRDLLWFSVSMSRGSRGISDKRTIHFLLFYCETFVDIFLLHSRSIMSQLEP